MIRADAAAALNGLIGPVVFRPPDPPPPPPPPVEAAPEPAQRRSTTVRAWQAGRYVFNLVTATVMLAALITAALVGVTFGTGHRLETVITGSMQPQIPIGSLVVTEHVAASQLQVGNIIVFPAPCDPGKIVVHRIVQETVSAGNVLIHTKGDANPVADSWLSNCSVMTSTGALSRPLNTTTDRVVYILPYAGNTLDVARRIALILLLVTGGLVVLGFGVREVRRFARRQPASQP
ncbi:MAG: signal peptidase I [Candidatus Dormibacteraeota bacterium]|nr:signal peptidase I [Candidatus Dormibacteraeota bacterium]